MSKSEDLIGFIKQLMNQVASHLANRRVLKGLYKWKIFIGRGRGKGTVKRKGIIFDPGTLPFVGEETRKGFHPADCLFFLWEVRAHVTDDLTGA